VPGSLLPFVFAAAGAAGSGAPATLALLSAAALVLALGHRRANLGTRAALVFLAATCGYGLLRALSIRGLSASFLGGMPYRLNAPVLTFWGVPLQELVGWTVAAALASYFTDRLLRRGGQSTDPYRTALLAAICMAAVCLAVETAAVIGGWWSWSLAHSQQNLLVFPSIALVDWAFVAIDFLLPFELWRRSAPLSQRLLSLVLFPLHLAGHAFTTKLPGPLPISAFGLVHIALVAAVLAAAAASQGKSPWPSLSAEKHRFWPLAATLVLLATTTAQLLVARQPQALWTGLPLLGLALLATFSRSEPAIQGVAWRPRRAAGLFGVLLLLGLALLVPSARSSRDFERHLLQAAKHLAASDLAAAMPDLARAQELRPDHSETLLLLGWAEMQRGNRQAARRYLESSLAKRPSSQEAKRFLAILDQQEASPTERGLNR